MPDFTTVLSRFKDKLTTSMRVSMPGVIASYDHKTQKASVKVDIQELFEDGSSLESPVITNVPVVMPASGGAFFSMPVKAGDFCLLVICDRDISNWLFGSSNQKPTTSRKHSLTDAVAIMGLRPFTKTSNIPNNTDVTVFYAGSTISIGSDGTVTIDSKQNIHIKSKNDINIVSTNKINLHSDEISVKSVKSVNIDCADANIKASGNIKIESKALDIHTSNDLTLNCQNAIVKASGNIQTTAQLFEHKGNLKINGDLDLSGSGKIGNGLTCNGGITNTGGNLKSNNITLETHTHSYIKAIVGSSPTAVEPSTTGNPQ